jgi:hypothetical protein
MLSLLRRFFTSYEFILKLRDGTARAVKGKLIDRMLREFTECARQHGLTRGTIYGERGPGVVRLAFSKEIPPSTHQQFRNIWSQFQ